MNDEELCNFYRALCITTISVAFLFTLAVIKFVIH